MQDQCNIQVSTVYFPQVTPGTHLSLNPNEKEEQHRHLNTALQLSGKGAEFELTVKTGANSNPH